MINLKAIIFDFDGVICESTEIKDRAYYQTYLPYGKDVAEYALKYHKENEGVSRVKVFPYIHKTLLNITLKEEELNKIVKKYSQTVVNQVINAPLVNGVQNFLEKYSNKLPLYMSSGTPQDEMRQITTAKNLTKYFKNVYGSPDTKDIHITRILNSLNIEPQQCIFVGDATTDRDMAKKKNVNFVARIKPDSLLNDESLKIFDFWDLENIIKNLCKID